MDQTAMRSEDASTGEREFADTGDMVDPGYTLVATHRVLQQHVADFLQLQCEFDERVRSFAGYRGTELLRPVPGVQDAWTALVRFDTQAAVDSWTASPERRELTRRLDDVVERYETDVVGSSFGRWFRFTMTDGNATPNWKQWLTVLLVLYPTVMLLSLGTRYLPGGVESSNGPANWFFLNLWVGNFLSTFLLTFLLMPVVTRALRFWLRPDAVPAVTLAGTALLIALFFTSLVLFGLAWPGGFN